MEGGVSVVTCFLRFGNREFQIWHVGDVVNAGILLRRCACVPRRCTAGQNESSGSVAVALVKSQCGLLNRLTRLFTSARSACG